MKYISILYVIGGIIYYANPLIYYGYLSLNMEMILGYGEVWRLITFIIFPPGSSNILFLLITIYLYYFLGTQLENIWGAFKFNLYFFMGIIFNILAAFIAYVCFGEVMLMTTYYLNMSLFLAFAMIYPNSKVYLFFILPVKMIWLAIIYAVYIGFTVFYNIIGYILVENGYIYTDIIGVFGLPSIAVGLSAFISILNFIIFFCLIGKNLLRGYGFAGKMSGGSFKDNAKRKKRQRDFQSRAKTNDNMVHKCHICGRTSESNPELNFRYCSKCNGGYEYCEEHLFTHEHVK